MKSRKLSIKAQMLLYAAATSLVVFLVMAVYSNANILKMVKTTQKDQLSAITANCSELINAELSNAKAIIGTLAHSYSHFQFEDEDDRSYNLMNIDKQLLNKHPNFKSIKENWIMLESDFVEVSAPRVETTTTSLNIASPLTEDDYFIGAITATIQLDTLKAKLTETCGENLAFLVSSDNVIFWSTSPLQCGLTVSEVLPALDEASNLSANIGTDKQFDFTGHVQGMGNVMMRVTPIEYSKGKYWTLCTTYNKGAVLNNANKASKVVVLLSIIGAFAITLLVWLTANKIIAPIKELTESLNKLALGDVNNAQITIAAASSDIEKIHIALDKLLNGLKDTTEFANQIGTGNLDAQFTPLSEVDTLGNSLLEMRANLQSNREEAERRKIEDDKVNWATSGLAKLGNVLHADNGNNNIKDLSYNILKNLIEYVGVNQGAFYIKNVDEETNDEVYDMTSAIAYDRRKFMQKQFRVGEDLIGRCAYERKTIYMTDVPQGYITITSGLGEATASVLLIVPLVINNEVFGIIELASFQPIDNYKIDFIERLAENIASTISTAKTAERTALMAQNAQFQKEELAAQEEEMRQNMEELQATQEESDRKARESEKMINIISSLGYNCEFDLDGYFLSANQNFCDLVGIPESALLGKSHKDVMNITTADLPEYNRIWAELKRGKTQNRTAHVTMNNNEEWLLELYSPLVDDLTGQPYKVHLVAINITKQRADEMRIMELESQVSALQLELGKAAQSSNNQTDVAKIISESEPEIPEPEPQHWDPAYDNGNPDFDGQNQQLLYLINELCESYKKSKSKKETKEIIQSLIDFTSYHFGSTEDAMKMHNYTEMVHYVEANQDITKELKKCQEQFNNGKAKAVAALLNIIYKWLPKHYKQLKEFAIKLQ
ncbi:MAG: GAF domain-containing protein [Salinivirgaceae bacterium]|nr:GAF domain-containing protein [Salinivirgaceae bacterium]